MGFKGIKLHLDYQNVFLLSKEVINLLIKAEELELYTVFHAGLDMGMPKPPHAEPKDIKSALSYVSGKYIIAAHLGGFAMWDDVEKYLVGSDVKFDTSCLSKYISLKQFKRIVLNHGSDKILFGTDMPWDSVKDTLSLLYNADFSQSDVDNILYKNALKILN